MSIMSLHFPINQSFASEAVIKNYCAYLEDYATLPPEGIHRVVNMFHRVMVKCKIETVFFKVILCFIPLVCVNVQSPRRH